MTGLIHTADVVMLLPSVGDRKGVDKRRKRGQHSVRWPLTRSWRTY